MLVLDLRVKVQRANVTKCILGFIAESKLRREEFDCQLKILPDSDWHALPPSPVAPPMNEEQCNCAICSMMLDYIAKLLRELFKRCWDAKHPNNFWQDTEDDGRLFMQGSPVDDLLPGTAKLTHNSGKVITSHDLSLLLCKDDKVRLGMEPGMEYTVADKSKPHEFTINHKWTGENQAAVEMYGQTIRCERNNNNNSMKDVIKRKMLQGDRIHMDISLLTFALINSSHELLSERSADQSESVKSIPDLRKQTAHGSCFSMSNEKLEEAKRTMTTFVEQCLEDMLPSWKDECCKLFSSDPSSLPSSESMYVPPQLIYG